MKKVRVGLFSLALWFPVLSLAMETVGFPVDLPTPPPEEFCFQKTRREDFAFLPPEPDMELSGGAGKFDADWKKAAQDYVDSVVGKLTPVCWQLLEIDIKELARQAPLSERRDFAGWLDEIRQNVEGAWPTRAKTFIPALYIGKRRLFETVFIDLRALDLAHRS